MKCHIKRPLPYCFFVNTDIAVRFALRIFLLFVLAEECEMLREVKRSEACHGQGGGGKVAGSLEENCFKSLKADRSCVGSIVG
jgi:hypothetical protein